MRIYMITDLEGVSGIVDIGYMDMSTDLYREARRLLTQDANAAIAGCFDAGASEVIVRDGHFTGNNLDTAMLDPRARLLKIPPAAPRSASLDGSFDALMLVGYHAMAGTLNGFLDHTMSSGSWFEYTINGRPTGEIGICATMAGECDVPLVYVSGDEAACREAEEFVPGVVTTPVKRGVGRNHATGMDPAQAHAAVRRDAAAALSRKKWPKPLKWRKPLKVQLTLYRTDQAEGFALRPGATRVGPRTVQKMAKNQQDVLF